MDLDHVIDEVVFFLRSSGFVTSPDRGFDHPTPETYLAKLLLGSLSSALSFPLLILAYNLFPLLIPTKVRVGRSG